MSEELIEKSPPLPSNKLGPVISIADAVPLNFHANESNCDRISASILIRHEHCGVPPIEGACRFSVELETIEQPYVRHDVVNNKWRKVDAGFLAKKPTGYLFINNRSKHDDPAVLEKMVLEVAYSKGRPFLVRPGRCFLAETDSVGEIYLRSQFGSVPITSIVMPA